MVSLNKQKFFFFYPDCREVIIRPNSIEHAYLAVLDEDLQIAEKIFLSIDSPRAIWGRVLLAVFRGYLDKYPTFFQIRNFLEIDLDFLLKNEKLDYVEQVLGCLEIFADINQETYKFAARVMYVNNLLSASYNYMQKSKEIYYNDAELHFMLAQYYMRVHDYEEAYFAIKECLKFIPEYYPALQIKHKIEEMEI